MSRSAIDTSLNPRTSADSTVLRILFAVAVGIAAVTRLGWLGPIEFQNDESWALSVAEAIARGQRFPLVGIGSSLNVPNAPFFVYLMAVPELINRDPSFATGLIGLLGTASVAATYAFSACCFDRVAGVASALLYAVSPWGIIYSRKIWGQDALPLFVTLGFWALFAAATTGRRWLIAPGILMLTLATQLHPTAFYLAPAALLVVLGCLWLAPDDPGPTLRWLGLGLLGAAIVEAPFFAWQARHGWPLVHAVASLARDPNTVDLDAARLAGSVIAGTGYPALAIVSNFWKPAGVVEAVLFLGGAALLARRAIDRSEGARRLIAAALLVWIVAPIALQTRHSVPLFPHYFIVLYPASFTIMGVAVSALWHVGRARATAGAWPPWVTPARKGVAIAALGIPLTCGGVGYADYVGALTRGAVRPEYGAPLDRQKNLLDVADRLASGGPVYFGTHDSLAPTLAYLSDGRWRIFDDRRGLWLPFSDRASVLVISDRTSRAAVLTRRWFAGEPPVVVGTSDRSSVDLYRLAPGAAETDPGYHATSIAFENGLALTGFRIAADASRQQILIDLHWRFTGPSPTRPPTVFNHLLDAGGETVAHVDGLAFEPGDWHQGDVFLDEFAMTWPRSPGPYHLELGLYDYPSMHRFSIVGPVQGSASDAIDLGPVTLTGGPPL